MLTPEEKKQLDLVVSESKARETDAMAEIIQEYPTEILEAELIRRKQQSKLEAKLPKPLEVPDYTGLYNMVVDGVLDCVTTEHEDEDFQHYIYEAAMEAVYGEGFWTWRNQQKW